MTVQCLSTGQLSCFDESGRPIPCSGSGQDGWFRKGRPWPDPRFQTTNDVVIDLLTGLYWTRDANIAGFPVTWQEALDFVAGLNEEKMSGYSDWRLPNRRELRSLMAHESRKPSLPMGHPFGNIFMGWYWTSTTAAINPAYAWYVHMEGARMFYGRKDQYCLLWPVRGEGAGALPVTGQRGCFDADGKKISCLHSGQDGELLTGVRWPEPRFEVEGETVLDRLTGLRWLRKADLSPGKVSWSEALELVGYLNESCSPGCTWRLPNINELESLVDCSRSAPALPEGHPFTDVRDVYWSSTTSFFETDWAWALYLIKGAVGVGIKAGRDFYAWPVSDI